MNSKKIVLNEISYFGSGARNILCDEIKKKGFKKAFVITDRDLIKTNVIKMVTKILDDINFPYEAFSEVKQNPTIDNVKNGVDAFFKSGADCIVVIGGGSSIDTAKAVGIITKNPGFSDVRSLEGKEKTLKRSTPIFAFPTTAGTAAEVTINYVITDEEKRKKMVCVDPNSIPIVSIIDPELMISMPPGLTAATGMDALTHAIEGYITKDAWIMTDMFELKAIELIHAHLENAVKNPSDMNAREGMALAQYIAGMGFSNVGLGIVHSMAHPLGAFYDIPHGVANAVLLPYVMEFNSQNCREKFKAIGHAMGVVEINNLPMNDAIHATIDSVRKLSMVIGIPQKLKEVGVKEDDLDELAFEAFNDICTSGNPREVSTLDILGIYKNAFK